MDPTRAAAVIIEQAFPDTVTMDVPQNPYGERRLFIVWTPTEHMVFDGEGMALPELANPDGVNPYGIMPIA